MKAAQMAAIEHMTGDVYRVGCDLERELNAANSIIRQQQLLDEENLRLQERIKRLEEALESIREYWNRDNNNRALVDACWYAIDTASEVLEPMEAKP
jgi:peptidoglycan hydrolase CwlO-like protein